MVVMKDYLDILISRYYYISSFMIDIDQCLIDNHNIWLDNITLSRRIGKLEKTILNR